MMAKEILAELDEEYINAYPDQTCDAYGCSEPARWFVEGGSTRWYECNTHVAEGGE